MNPQFAHNEARSRYELLVDGKLIAQAQYRAQGDALIFTHTEVDPAHARQGLASRLAGFALDDVKRRGLKAVPQCSFIARYIERHAQDYGQLVQH